MTREQFILIAQRSKSKRDLLYNLGRKDSGGGRKALAKLMIDFNVTDVTQFFEKKISLIEKKCLKCNKPFVTKAGKKGRKCCSNLCARSWSAHFVDRNKQRETMDKLVREGKFISWNKGLKFTTNVKSEKVLKFKGPKVLPRFDYECAQCKNIFRQTERESRNNKICVCSKDCRNILLPKVQSENLKSQYANGKKVFGGTSKWYQYGDMKVQGTYELRTCKILDEMMRRNLIREWQYAPCRMPYVGMDGKNHNYLIDFRVDCLDNTFYFIETKGWIRENDELKWKSVRDAGHNLQVWFLKDIEEKEIQFTGPLSSGIEDSLQKNCGS